jgi:hypothetical protein
MVDVQELMREAVAWDYHLCHHKHKYRKNLYFQMGAVRVLMIPLQINVMRTIFTHHHVQESPEEILMMLAMDVMFLVFVVTHKPTSHYQLHLRMVIEHVL